MPIHIIPVRGEGAGKGWGFDQKVKIPVKFQRVEKSLCSNVSNKNNAGPETQNRHNVAKARTKQREEDILVTTFEDLTQALLS